jgi:[glutamine synthetase] adenylyltransferase / [glutamine synthetase]-adenylyl-L-tyrosine phosphorylase
MSTQASLLKHVPLTLHEKVNRHWDAWQQACAKHELQSDLQIDLSLLGKIWACSDFVPTLCARYPDIWLDLVATDLLNQDINLKAYQSELESLLQPTVANNDFAIMQVLRRFRQKHMLRIAWRDLANLADTQQTLRNLTDLAEACVDTTLEFLHQNLCDQAGVPCDAEGNELRLVVLGMGKLGGHELNFSSDIDLIFAFSEEGETQGKRPVANSQFFTRLGQRFIKILNEMTADGFVFRVDMRLRPYGDSGPLAMSFMGMEQYYQTQGRDWERYAMIKARVIGGDRAAGVELMEMLKPFIYRRYLDFGAFESIREMKGLIDSQIKRKGNKNNIKLGKGGIREIEFIGQTFQLIRGGGDADLQIRSILAVLKQLSEKGFLTQQVTDELAHSYDFLRRLENRLQIYADGQTHLLPEDELIQQSITLSMDYDHWSDLLEASNQHRHTVHEHFNEVFSVPEFSTDDQVENELQILWQGEIDKEEAVELLKARDIKDDELIIEHLEKFRKLSVLKTISGDGQQRLDKLMPCLLDELSVVRKPGRALPRVLNLIAAIVRRSVYLSLLIEYPAALKQMMHLCAASPWIANLLARYPILLDQLLDPRELYMVPDKIQLAQELEIIMGRVEDDEEGQMEELRKFKQAKVLHVAAKDVAGAMSVFEVSEQLTLIAEVLLEKTYALAWQHLVSRHGCPQCEVEGEIFYPDMAIIAYGKMGGEELGYGSDLDLVFLHNSKGKNQTTEGDGRCLDNSTFFARLAQRIIHILGSQTANGRLYEVDMRLRPDGSAGMLVSSVDAFEQYQREKAWTWEYQALIRARMVLGSAHLGEEFDRIRRSVLTQSRDSVSLKNDVIEMRQKMRESLGSKGSKDQSQFHLKQDEGGIVDIEFIAQYKVLKMAAKFPDLVSSTATRQLLEGLQQHDILHDAQVVKLINAYEQYRSRAHQRALQEQSSLLEDDEFKTQRSDVIQIWQNVLG